MGDLDGDGFLDVFFHHSQINLPKFYRNDGFGNFAETPCAGFQGISLLTPVLVDFDNDGDKDVAVMDSNQDLQLYRNIPPGSDPCSFAPDLSIPGPRESGGGSCTTRPMTLKPVSVTSAEDP